VGAARVGRATPVIPRDLRLPGPEGSAAGFHRGPWSQHESILWAIVHGILSWFYVVYYALTR
jgi:hypothetical protein